MDIDSDLAFVNVLRVVVDDDALCLSILPKEVFWPKYLVRCILSRYTDDIEELLSDDPESHQSFDFALLLLCQSLEQALTWGHRRWVPFISQPLWVWQRRKHSLLLALPHDSLLIASSTNRILQAVLATLKDIHSYFSLKKVWLTLTWSQGQEKRWALVGKS